MKSHTGILELSNKANGRLRLLDQTLLALPNDPVVPADLIKRYELRAGLELEVELGKPHGNGQKQQHQRNPRGKKNRNRKRTKAPAIAPDAPLVRNLCKIDGHEPQAYLDRPKFEDLTTIDPAPRLTLEYPGCPPACRLIDLFCPIGYGQRGMIVSPPKAGKTESENAPIPSWVATSNAMRTCLAPTESYTD